MENTALRTEQKEQTRLCETQNNVPSNTLFQYTTALFSHSVMKNPVYNTNMKEYDQDQ